MPVIFSFPDLFISIVLLFFAFIIQPVTWMTMLNKSKYFVPLNYCIAGQGLSVFGKYIPGKIWTVVGRSAYIAGKGKLPLSDLTVLSLKTELVHIWVGLTLGALGLFFIGWFKIWGWLISIIWFGLTVSIFSSTFNKGIMTLINKIVKKSILIPGLNFRQTISILPWFLFYWVVLAVSFYFFVSSITDSPKLEFYVGLGFPLAGTLGIMAVIFPGGLGIRETILVGFNNLAGFTIIESTTIAISARIWFILGELFIFILGYFISKNSSSEIDLNR